MSELRRVELEKPFPGNRDAELTILGAIMLGGVDYADVAAELSVDAFSSIAHQVVYRAMGRVLDAKLTIDPITVKSELESAGEIDRIGGPAGLAELLGQVRFSNVESYIRLVQDAATRRRLIHIGNAIMAMAFDADTPAPEQVDRAERLIGEVEVGGGKTVLRTASELGHLSIQALEDFVSSDRTFPGIATGLVDLDYNTGGLRRKEQVILAARPSMGKTALGCRMIAGIAGSSHNADEPPVQVFFSLEMPAEQIIQRVQFGLARIDSARVRRKAVQKEDWRSLAGAQALIDEYAPIIIDDTARRLGDFRRVLRAVKREYGRVDVIMLDHIGLVDGQPRPGENRNLEVGRISYQLKEMAKEFNAAEVVLCQLSRQVNTRGGNRPTLGDLRDSGEIEQNADAVFFPHREHYYNREADVTDAELAIAKQRNGPTCTLKLHWTPESAWYDNAARGHEWQPQ